MIVGVHAHRNPPLPRCVVVAELWHARARRRARVHEPHANVARDARRGWQAHEECCSAALDTHQA
jgi:hypothetical protein